ncbi:MAG TPA: tRNA lysidine(34) synthetase TilS [Aurantimonas coralicida]|uniref:tRNA(Ile)-lysidine synthase n=2 Tax=root TaxID=1 RepID=A0A9C9NLG9_9HYPH|nr:tRNA lysidine(34) synthetase TilS [Aurantimonas coralicida]HEU03279.1 tRNA lysidine(34) synthetase TilS [Aurantimonas coralicida]
MAQAASRIGRPKRAVLAVSGGPDSLALLLAASDARKTPVLSDIQFDVVTVDHGLRQRSAIEADFVASIARSLALPHKTMRWAKPAHSGNLPAAARRARYGLLLDAARQSGATVILTAHHQDDQLETHLLARARGAGETGLAGMRWVRDIAPGVALVRPFLDVPGGRLKATVAAAGMRAVDDPTNADVTYHRVRLRQQLAAGDIDRRRLEMEIASHAARRDAGEAKLAATIGTMAAKGEFAASGGTLVFDRAALAAIERSTAFLLMQRAIAAVAGGDYAPGGRSVMRLVDALRGPDDRIAVSLGGALVDARSSVTVVREFGRTGIAGLAPADLVSHVVFDGRFDIRLSRDHCNRGAGIVAFGSLGRGNRIEQSLPVLTVGTTLVAVPEALARKAGAGVDRLEIASLVAWRLMRDLPLSRCDAAVGMVTAVTKGPGRPKHFAAKTPDDVGKEGLTTYL